QRLQPLHLFSVLSPALPLSLRGHLLRHDRLAPRGDARPHLSSCARPGEPSARTAAVVVMAKGDRSSAHPRGEYLVRRPFRPSLAPHPGEDPDRLFSLRYIEPCASRKGRAILPPRG